MSQTVADQDTIPEGQIIEKFEDFYRLWADVPVLVQLDEDGAKLQHPVLTAILKVLRTGVKDDNGKIRYFLTVNELLEELPPLLKNLVDKPVKKSMLYYYLDILQSMNLIIHVYYIDGRHKRKYFGRTGKFFLFGDQDKVVEKTNTFFSTFVKFLSIKDPKFTEEKAMEIMQNSMDILIKEGEKINALIHREEKLLLDHDIDAKEIYENFWYFLPFLMDIPQLKPLLDLISSLLNE